MVYKKIFSYRNYLLFYLLIIFLLNLSLLEIPLLNVFGYEFSVFNSVLITFLSGIYIISSAKKEDDFNGFISKLYLPAACFLAVPFLTSVINSFFTGFCSFSDGLFFYLVITFPSVVTGYALGLTSYILFKKFKKIFFFFIIILILLIALAEFYFNPQVYFYNAVLGYLPGTIYDEGLSVDYNLITYRILNLIYFGLLLYSIFIYLLKKIKLKRIFLLFYLVIIPVIFILLSPSLDYSTTFTKLRNELHNKVSTEHFDIYLDRRISDEFVSLIALHHEYYFKELKEFLQTSPSQRIESYIFYERIQKKKLFGSANADVAKPWLYSIYTTYDNYNTTLRHEIAHCFSAEFGEGLFKVADMINPFLIEGLASASDPFYDENDIHFTAAAAYDNNFKINIEEMFDITSFFKQVSSLSYVYAGSFSKYLIDNYGIENFKRFYSNPDVEKIYKKPITLLEKEYIGYLEKFDTENTEDKAYYYFGRRSIFYKVCPRFIADRLNTAWYYFQNEDYEKAEEIFKYTLERAETYSAVAGLAGILAETGRVDSAIYFVNGYLKDFEKTSYYYNLLFSLGDLYAREGNYQKADSIYNILVDKDPSSVINYLSALRRALINDDNQISTYLTGSNKEKYKLLKTINKNSYVYSSFPVMAELSKVLDEDYSLFTRQFDKTMFINDYQSAYSVFKLSEYMAENLDFNRARKMAALSLRFKKNKNLSMFFSENYKKLNWFYHNSERILESIKHETGELQGKEF